MNTLQVVAGFLVLVAFIIAPAFKMNRKAH